MNDMILQDAYAIAAYIKAAVKTTPVKLYVNGDFEGADFGNLKVFGAGNSLILFG